MRTGPEVKQREMKLAWVWQVTLRIYGCPLLIVHSGGLWPLESIVGMWGSPMGETCLLDTLACTTGPVVEFVNVLAPDQFSPDMPEEKHCPVAEGSSGARASCLEC